MSNPLQETQQETRRNRRGTNPKSLENLAKGRNKRGAPKRGESWAELIAQVGHEKTTGEAAKLGATWKLAVVRAAYRHAAAGNASILRELMERSEGKVKDTLELSGKVDSAITVNFINDGTRTA